jgi:hypothetical protein
VKARLVAFARNMTSKVETISRVRIHRLTKVRDKGKDKANGRKERIGAEVVAHGNVALVFQFSEHIFYFVVPFIKCCVMSHFNGIVSRDTA